MASSSARTSSEALKSLREQLHALSKQLHEISDVMNADMTRVGNEWQDGKYQEFMDGYKPQIQKCNNIADRYEQWCKEVLDQAIIDAEATEHTNVVADGIGSSIGRGSATAAVGGTAAAASVGAIGSSKVFNMGGEKNTTPDSTLGTKIAQAVSEGRATGAASAVNKKGSKKASQEFKGILSSQIESHPPKKTSKWDKACKEYSDGELNHGKLGTPNDYTFEHTENKSAADGASVNSGISGGIPAGIFKGNLSSTISHSETKGVSDKIYIKCSEDAAEK